MGAGLSLARRSTPQSGLSSADRSAPTRACSSRSPRRTRDSKRPICCGTRRPGSSTLARSAAPKPTWPNCWPPRRRGTRPTRAWIRTAATALPSSSTSSANSARRGCTAWRRSTTTWCWPTWASTCWVCHARTDPALLLFGRWVAILGAGARSTRLLAASNRQPCRAPSALTSLPRCCCEHRLAGHRRAVEQHQLVHRAQYRLQLRIHQQHGHALGRAAAHGAPAPTPEPRRPLRQAVALVARQHQAERRPARPVVLERNRHSVQYRTCVLHVNRSASRSFAATLSAARLLAQSLDSYHGVQCHPERSEPASEVEGSAPR